MAVKHSKVATATDTSTDPGYVHKADWNADHSIDAGTVTEAQLASATSAKLVTNGDTHDHNGGDGAQIAHSSLGSIGATDHHSNANDPGADEKAALAGTSGTPSVTNKYVTNADSRNTDTRDPKAHAHAPADVTGTAVIDNDGRLIDDRTPSLHGSTKHNGTIGTEGQIDFSTTTGHTHSGVDSKATAHEGQASPHSGHATLSGGLVPTAELGGIGADGTKYLRGDQSWQVPTAAVSITQVEIDIGALPVGSATLTIADATVSASSKLMGQIAYVAPTGKDLDELEMDDIQLLLAPGNKEVDIFIRGLEGYIADKFVINYMVGA